MCLKRLQTDNVGLMTRIWKTGCANLSIIGASYMKPPEAKPVCIYCVKVEIIFIFSLFVDNLICHVLKAESVFMTPARKL